MKRILFLVAMLMAFGCTENERAKQFGGEMVIDLPAGQTLEDVTWKEDNLWYMTRERRVGEQVETHTFKEDSSWGVLSGTVVFKEH